MFGAALETIGEEREDEHRNGDGKKYPAEHQGESDVPEIEFGALALDHWVLRSKIRGRHFTDVCSAELADLREDRRTALGAVSYLFGALQMRIIEPDTIHFQFLLHEFPSLSILNILSLDIKVCNSVTR